MLNYTRQYRTLPIILKPPLFDYYYHLNLFPPAATLGIFIMTEDLLKQINHNLERIADALDRLAPTTFSAPSYQYPLENFGSFNWDTIGATVVQNDQYGAAIVSWKGQQFVRRSPQNKFGEAIWFSRSVGKDENGENKYERLITFKPMSKVEVEPVPNKVMKHIT